MRAPPVIAIPVVLLTVACASRGTPLQRQTRADFEACRDATSGLAYGLVVHPDGRFEFQTPSTVDAEAMAECMNAKGHSAAVAD